MNYKTKIFSEMALSYLVCCNDDCPLAGRCLRREVAGYVPAKRRIVECVNAAYVASKGGKCEYFRPAEPTLMHKGLVHFYDQIPERTARKIRSALILDYGSSNYYRYRNGEQPITPEVESHIRTVCQQFGWTADLVFDEETEEYKW